MFKQWMHTERLYLIIISFLVYIRTIAHWRQGWEFALWFFCANCTFFDSKSVICSFQIVNRFFWKSDKANRTHRSFFYERWKRVASFTRSENCNLLFCYGHKKEKSMVKRTDLERIILKKSKKAKERIPIEWIKFSAIIMLSPQIKILLWAK